MDAVLLAFFMVGLNHVVEMIVRSLNNRLKVMQGILHIYNIVRQLPQCRPISCTVARVYICFPLCKILNEKELQSNLQ